MSQGPQRNTATRDRHRRIIKRGRPDCGECGEPIDYEAHHLDPMSFQVDHIIPLSRGGTDTLDNKQACHRKCNRDKSDKMPGDDDSPTPVEGVTYVTERHWTP